MMLFLKRFLVVAMLCACLAVMPFHARAELNIAVVDIQKLLTSSEAAQSIQKQLETKRDALQSEFAGYEQELFKKEKALIEGQGEMSPEEVSAKRKEFETELLRTRKLVQEKRQQLERSVGEASEALKEEIFSLVADITKRENYQLVLTRQNVVLVEKSIDITDEVMASLNKKISNISLKN